MDSLKNRLVLNKIFLEVHKKYLQYGSFKIRLLLNGN